jgi:catechol 2,3-dioxygenase-like lactoylglutathione lyase family enzyme
MTTVRYIVDDVDDAVTFFTSMLDFELAERWGGPFAMVTRDDLSLWLAGPGSSARQPMPDGRSPEPGGWNRLVLTVSDLASTVERLRDAGAIFRNEIVTGPGGNQIVIDDPSGNPIELFQPAGSD